MKSSLSHLYAIFFATAGFALWVLADTCMKLAGEADLPSYEVVGILGICAVAFLIAINAPKRRLEDLWPKRPGPLAFRGLLAFGCVMANTVALKHLPLTLFYVAVFTSPMIVAILGASILREHLGWTKVAAIIVGFAGVVIAIDPWNNFGGGDWIGYGAATVSVLFYVVMTLWMRKLTQTETPLSMTFITGLVEAVLGIGLMLWHAVPVAPALMLILVAMGVMNVVGNLCNAHALLRAPAATVEQFHYTQIIFGAVLGYLIWHDVPTAATIIGAAIIIASGLYVAATAHRDNKHAAVSDT